MAQTRKATAQWKGGLKDGNGRMSVETKAFTELPYSFTTRFEDTPGTNPEELIAAAHAGCFSMALSGELGKAGLAPESLTTQATLTLEKQEAGWTVTRIKLAVTGRVPDATAEAFAKAAEAAKKGCPVSRLLNTDISLEARLEGAPTTAQAGATGRA